MKVRFTLALILIVLAVSLSSYAQGGELPNSNGSFSIVSYKNGELTLIAEPDVFLFAVRLVTGDREVPFVAVRNITGSMYMQNGAIAKPGSQLGLNKGIHLKEGALLVCTFAENGADIPDPKDVEQIVILCGSEDDLMWYDFTGGKWLDEGAPADSADLLNAGEVTAAPEHEDCLAEEPAVLWSGVYEFTVANGQATLLRYNGDEYASKAVIPDQVEGCRVIAVGDSAFENCSNLTSVTIPDSVIAIGDRAFYDCTQLAGLIFPESILSIGDGAFYGCKGLTEITIPNSVHSLGASAFSRCAGLTEVVLPDGLALLNTEVFFYCSNLKAVTIPDRVHTIARTSFQGCSSLTSITIPEGVSSIGSFAFAYCSRLAEITIPDSVTRIGANAFTGCSELKNFTIPAGVTEIEDGLLKECTQLSSVFIPDGVSSIGLYAFYQAGLTSVAIPGSVESISGGAFAACEKLAQIELAPENTTFELVDGILYNSAKESLVAYINNMADSNCSILDGTRSIGYSAFYNAPNLTAVTIPDSVTFIGEAAFAGCNELVSAHIPGGVSAIERAVFDGCLKLAGVNIPEGVVSIGNTAFRNCRELGAVVIPGSVETIGSWAFENCEKLAGVTFLGDAVQIDKTAFSQCKGLSITAYEGSSAAQYAEENGIPCVVMERQPLEEQQTAITEAVNPALQQEPLSSEAPDILESSCILTITDVAIADLSSFKIKAIQYVDENGAEATMPLDLNNWFQNATVRGIMMPANTSIIMEMGGSGITAQMAFTLAEGSALEVTFAVEGTEYIILVGPGKRLVVEKTGDGHYLLLPNETAVLASAAADAAENTVSFVEALTFGITSQASEARCPLKPVSCRS